ncbi:MAG: hypothetical protein WKF78_14280 [Candidatus Limnocylindrales bacterium]
MSHPRAAGRGSAGPRWWAGKVRQSWAHHAGLAWRPQSAWRLAGWLTDPQRALFDRDACRRPTPRTRRRVASLQGVGTTCEDLDILVAGLLHDAGKGQTGIAARIVYALGQRYGPWIWRTRWPCCQDPAQR